MFFGAVAVLGAGVRVVRAAGGPGPASSQPALDRQIRSSDSARQAPRSGKKKKTRSTPRPVDRRGYVGNRLDIDVATAAQIDSLPGITPFLAKRIVADRMARGPFTSADGLRRVIGVTNAFLKRIDTLITFSGAVIQPSLSDTVIPKRRRARRDE